MATNMRDRRDQLLKEWQVALAEAKRTDKPEDWNTALECSSIHGAYAEAMTHITAALREACDQAPIASLSVVWNVARAIGVLDEVKS